jgi:FixJ family two-component response regulator
LKNFDKTLPAATFLLLAAGRAKERLMMIRRTTVLLADDHAIVSEGLAALLVKHGFDVVATVRDGHALVDEAKRLRPDVIVTDLSMPGLSGLDALARLKVEHVDSKVIVLTMHDHPDLATVAMRAGASGFLLKDSAAGEVVSPPATAPVQNAPCRVSPLPRRARECCWRTTTRTPQVSCARC